MHPARIIAAKRDGEELTAAQIREFVMGFSSGAIPDYQVAAWAMAVFLRGMTPAETAALTDAMLHSGECLAWTDGAPVVDKHSTGGVGDKVSLLLAPLLACCGMRVPMISGRGLGATGGTLDKLESIPGFRTQLERRELQAVVEEVGCAIVGASEDVAPADRKLYALRDVTATVASIPLITASIMSKKLAEGLDALVLDVKCGRGAFMKTREQAGLLAQLLVDTGQRMGVTTSALISSMDQPLGVAVGNANEVAEVVAGLEGDCSPDLRQLTIELAAQLLCSTGAIEQDARRQLDQAWDSGAARERFEKMVFAQGGDLAALPPLASACEIRADDSGIVCSVDSEKIGWLLIDLGGGRRVTSDRVDHQVGIDVHVKLGERVRAGDRLATLYARTPSDELQTRLRTAFQLTTEAAHFDALILHRVNHEAA